MAVYRARILMIGASFVWLAMAADASQKPSRTIWDGVYEARQASAGEEVYLASCAGCHGSNLEGGGAAGALAGPAFLETWRNTTLQDFYARVSTTMPQDAPGSLAAVEYASVVAFILQANEAPTGAAPLPLDTKVLAGIAIVEKP